MSLLRNAICKNPSTDDNNANPCKQRMLFLLGKKFVSKDIKVALGPHARKCCYEVGKEFETIFPNHISHDQEKTYLDMSRYITDYLKKLNIEFEDVNVCTVCSDRYYSYRENKTSNRQYSFLCI